MKTLWIIWPHTFMELSFLMVSERIFFFFRLPHFLGLFSFDSFKYKVPYD